MMTNQKPRIWLSNRTPQAGELIRVRAVTVHRMETGLRLNADNERIPRNIINSFIATFNGEPILSWEPESAVAQNPYLEFTFVVKESGTLSMRWEDDQKNVITSDTDITVT